MQLIICIENRGGILFHQRRVSMDRRVRQFILQHTKDHVLWMSEYSMNQFKEELKDEEINRIQVSDEFFSLANKNQWCFVEEAIPDWVQKRVERILFIHWNRTYPADVFFNQETIKDNWEKVLKEEIKGFSHEKITIEEFVCHSS